MAGQRSAQWWCSPACGQHRKWSVLTSVVVLQVNTVNQQNFEEAESVCKGVVIDLFKNISLVGRRK